MAHIIIAEDDAVSRRVLGHLLEGLHHTVTACRNGQEAYAHIAENPQAYDLLITDIAMPELDGVTLLNDLRDKLNCTIPTMAVTAYHRDIFNTELINQFEAWLMKPVSKAALGATVDCLLWAG